MKSSESDFNNYPRTDLQLVNKLRAIFVSLLVPVATALAQTITVTPSPASYSAAGGTITFTVSQNYPAAQSALALSVGSIPGGWTFGATGGANVPPVAPSAGDTGPFDFAFTNIPINSANFTFTVNYPAGLSGNQTIGGMSAVFRPTGGALQVVAVAPIVLVSLQIAPSFTTHPTGISTVVGANVSFTAAASGIPSPTISWLKDGTPLQNGGRISGATTPTLQITGAQLTDAGSYRAVAFNGVGSPATSNSASLNLTTAAQTITFGALVAKTYGDAPFALGATASSGLPVSYASSNSSVATVSGNTVTIAGGGSATITASQAGDANFAPAPPVAQVLTVNKATATVVLGSLAASYDGTPQSATATTNPSGLTVAFTYNGSATAPTEVGTYAVVGTVSSNNYTGSAGGSLVIVKANQSIFFAALEPRGPIDPPFSLTATATSGLTVNYASSNPSVATVSGSTVTITGVGTTTITASQPGNANYNPAADVAQSLTVGRTSQSITFGALLAKTYGDAPFALGATASSGLPVSYSSSNASVATVSGNTVTIAGGGSATITASQAGDATFAPAPPVAHSLTVNKATATVILGGLTAAYDGTPKVATATTNPGGLVVSHTYNGSPTAPTNVGTYAVVGTISNNNYAGSASGTLNIVKGEQSITFAALAPKGLNDPPFALTATASSGLAISYTSSNLAVATVSGSTVTMVGAGTTTITASQTGNANYNPAADVGQPLSVGKTNQTIAFGPLATRVFPPSSTFPLTATASSGLPVGYISSNLTVATIAGNIATVVGSGSATITASQAGDAIYNPAPNVAQILNVSAGGGPPTAATVSLGNLGATYDGTPKSVSATTTPPGLNLAFTYNGASTAPTDAGSYSVVATVVDANYTGSATGTLTIAKATQSITFGALPAKAPGDAPFALSATTTSNLPLSFTSSNLAVATVSGVTATIVGAGTTTITASQPGNNNYNPATDVAQPLSVGKTNQTISFGALASKTFPPTSSFALTATASSNLPVSYASSNLAVATIAGTTATVVGTGSTTITASQAGDATYNPAPNIQQNLTVTAGGSPPPPPPPPPPGGGGGGGGGGGATNAASVFLGNLTATFDGTPKRVSATTTPSSLAVTFTYNGSTTPPTDAGNYAVVGRVVDLNYTGSAAGTLTIAKAPQAIAFGAMAAKTFGDAPFVPGATASSDLPLSFNSSNPAVASVSRGTITIASAGTTTITASQSGDANRLAAFDANRTLTVNKAAATVTLGALSATYDGTPKNAIVTTVPAGLPATITYNGGAALPSAAGDYAVSATVVHPNYSGSAVGTLSISTDRDVSAYFGTFGGDGGNFSILIRANRTAVFLGLARIGGIPLIVRDFAIEADGSDSFSFTATVSANPPGPEFPTETGSPSVAAANAEYSISGAIGPDGSLAGSIAGLNLSFSAPPARTTGASRALAGFYLAGAAGKSATSFTIVGAGGEAYVLTTDGATSDSAKGTISGVGVFAATSESNARFVGLIDGPSATINLTATMASGVTVVFSGANHDARTEVEKIVNVSTRSQTGGAAGSLIVGFAIVGSEPKPVLLRAIGPTLTAFNVTGALSAARLEVFRGQTSLAVGNDWGTASNSSAIATAATSVGAFALPPNSRDASLLLNLDPGSYSVVVTGQDAAAGVSLVEIYDATRAGFPRSDRIVNIATRASVGTGDNALIAGFFITGTVPKRVLIRGVGPALAQFGVPGVLARPLLVVNSAATILAQNAGWSVSVDATVIATAALQVGAFALPAGSQDSALILNLAPGAYTAGVTGSGGTTGVALLEIYEVP